VLLLSALALSSPLLPPAAGDGPPLPPDRTGRLYVSGYSSDDVGEFLPDGTLLRTFTAPGMLRPRGVAVDDSGNVVVVGEGNPRIFVFDLEGELLREVTHPELTSGTGLARSASGHWYVGNFSPGRIVVFDADWTYRGKIEVAGMQGVNCVSFDRDGGFAVTDAANDTVHLFDAAHAHVGTIHHASLHSPMSIAQDSRGDHYVSSGAGAVTKFDADWTFLTVFGASVLAGPQGIAVDEHDRLTITNFYLSRVHRFDARGTLLESFPLTGVTTARNLAFQISPWVLAREGAVDAAAGYPVRVLSANGLSGDALGRITLAASDPLRIEMAASPGGPSPARLVLYAFLGEPDAGAVTALPFEAGLFAFPPPFAGGAPIALVNSIGNEALLGRGRLPAVEAPAILLDLPRGLRHPMTLTLQGILADDGSAGGRYSATNALVVELQ